MFCTNKLLSKIINTFNFCYFCTVTTTMNPTTTTKAPMTAKPISKKSDVFSLSISKKILE